MPIPSSNKYLRSVTIPGGVDIGLVQPPSADGAKIAEYIQRQVHDEGNARIGKRMAEYFRLDDERDDE